MLRAGRNLPVVADARDDEHLNDGHAGDERRRLPSVERVLADLDPAVPHGVRARIARAVIAEARAGRLAPAAVGPEATRRAADFRTGLLGPVINATGVLLHTNLGRAPIGRDAVEAMIGAAGYANVEYRLTEGVRGSRHEHAGALLAEACGAEAGIVVNNNAAAVLLVLAALARDRRVVVSRGELVEIGGGFRVPDILAETGARLVEVGTTNRTTVDDYERALDDDVALVMKIHASNYRMVGFVAAAGVAELAPLGRPVVVDAGSGLLDDTVPWLAERPEWLRDEPGVRQCLDGGAALVTFSGDKLLGGPQAGIVVGRRELIDRMKAHPLARALRADKVTLAGLQAVAAAYLDGQAGAIPFWRMAATPVSALAERAGSVVAALTSAGVTATAITTEAVAGGGALPGLGIPSAGVAVDTRRAVAFAAALRTDRIVARIEDGRVVCDLRTVDPTDDDRLVAALVAASTPTGASIAPGPDPADRT